MDPSPQEEWHQRAGGSWLTPEVGSRGMAAQEWPGRCCSHLVEALGSRAELVQLCRAGAAVQGWCSRAGLCSGAGDQLLAVVAGGHPRVGRGSPSRADAREAAAAGPVPQG